MSLHAKDLIYFSLVVTGYGIRPVCLHLFQHSLQPYHTVTISICHADKKTFLLLPHHVIRQYPQKRSNDERNFEVPLEIARMFEALCPDEIDEDDRDIDCLRISGDLLEKIIGFCKDYQEEAMREIEFQNNQQTLEEIVMQEQYLNFIKSFDRDGLFQLIQAANYADIKPLMSLSVLALCVQINNKSEDEIRDIFNIPKPVPADEAAKQDEKSDN